MNNSDPLDALPVLDDDGKSTATHDSGEKTDYGSTVVVVQSPNVTKLLRRIDLRLLPILLACYTLQFIDKVLMNYANIMGLEKDTGLQGNQFTWLATGFYIAFGVAQIPGIYLLARLPVNLYLGYSLVISGVAVACTAACNSFGSLLAVRIILAIAESTVAPSLSLVTMKWYTRQESSKRFGVWYCGVGLGQIIGGLLSFSFQHLRHSSLANWRGMFLTLGSVNIIVAIWVLFCLTDNPTTASFLSAPERAYFAQRVLTNNKSSVATRRFRLSQVTSTVTSDLAFWLVALTAGLSTLPSGAITTFSATLIAGFGYSSEDAALLNMPSGAVAIAGSLLGLWFVEKRLPRSVAILALVVPSIIGGALLSFAQHSQAGSLLGIWLINASPAIFVVTMNWGQANCAGHTKRTTYNAMIMIMFGISNICGPQTFQAKDAPNYLPAKITILAAVASSGLTTLLLVSLYTMRNSRRKDEEVENLLGAEEVDKIDFEVKGFKYVY